jgi:hypothetical protein
MDKIFWLDLLPVVPVVVLALLCVLLQGGRSDGAVCGWY